MKKLMSIMLALALTTGVATVTLAQDGKDEDKKTKKGSEKGQRRQDRRPRTDQGDRQEG